MTRIFSFFWGLISGRKTQGWSPSDQKACEQGLQQTSRAAELVFPVFHRNRTKIAKIQSFLGSHQYRRLTKEPAHIRLEAV